MVWSLLIGFGLGLLLGTRGTMLKPWQVCALGGAIVFIGALAKVIIFMRRG